MGLSGPLIDHINRQPLDNRRGNLRACTWKQNQANRGVNKDNKIGAKGVVATGRRFRAKIGVNGKQIHLGYFDTIAEAAAAYIAAAKKHFGEYACAG